MNSNSHPAAHSYSNKGKEQLKIRRPRSACTVFLSYVESKIWFKIQNPKSEIQNPKSNIRKSKIQNPKFAHKDLLHNVPNFNPKSKIRNPKSKIRNPKSKIPRQNPKFGVLGASQKELLHNDPKSIADEWKIRLTRESFEDMKCVKAQLMTGSAHQFFLVILSECRCNQWE